MQENAGERESVCLSIAALATQCSAQGEAQVGCKGGDPQRAGQDGPEVELEQQAGEGGGQRLRALTQLQQDDQVLSGGEERAGEAKKG